MRIPSGVTDQVIYFVAVDATDFTTRETGLSAFAVYRARNGGAAAAMTTPTIAEVDSTNMPGLYTLLLDEDMTIDAGDDSQEMAFHITHAGMAPVTRTIELYRPKITAGETISVSGGAVSNVTLVATTTTNTDMRGTDNALLAASAPVNFGDLSISATTGLVDITQSAADKAWSTASRVLTANTNLNDPTAAQIRAEMDSNSTQLAAIVADTNELQTDWANGGRLDLILDARASQTSVDTIDGIVDAIFVDTDTTIPGLITGLSIPTAVQVRQEIDSNSTQLAAIVADTTELQADWADGGRLDLILDARASQASVDALNNVSVSDVLNTQMSESYAADGASPTLAQALFLIQQSIGDFAISGTTLTVRRLDGSTAAATYTLDSASAPTSRTRST